MGCAVETAPPQCRWTEDDGVYVVKRRSFQFFITGHDLLAEKVRGGSFEGRLGDLIRWLNTNRRSPSPRVLMGGEITADAPVAKFEIDDGTSVQQALVQYARVTGDGWNLVIRDSTDPMRPLTGTWSGAYVTRLSDWLVGRVRAQVPRPKWQEPVPAAPAEDAAEDDGAGDAS